MSLPRYPAYKDSGFSWLGEVPAHWSINPIKRNFMIVGGSTPKSDVPAYWDGDIVWVSPADLSRLNSNYVNNSARRITQLGLESCGTTLVPPGSIVLSTRAPIGSLGIADVELCTNQGCKSLVPVAGMKSQFTAYALFSATTQLNLRGKGTTFLELSSDELGAFPIPTPPLSEQAAIEAFLNRETTKIDALIAEQEKLIALLAEKRQATISHAVTRGLDQNVQLKDSGVPWLGKVPAYWEITRLKHVTDLIVDCPHETPVYDDTGNYLVIRTADISEGQLDTRAMYSVGETEYLNRIRRQALAKDDIVYGREGERWGYAALVPEDDIFCLGQRMMQFRAGKDICPRYLMWQLNSRSTYRQGQIDTVGATSPHVNVGTIRNYALAKPPHKEQVDISSFLDEETSRLDALDTEAIRTINLLKERRAALISAAVTGKIDVRSVAA